MDVSESLRDVSQIVAMIAWTAVYALMVKRGVQDKTFAMPLTALSIDLGWEFYFSFLAEASYRQWIPAMPWLAINLGVFYTAYRYGREDFDWPILRRWFRPILVAMVLVASFLVWSFVEAFGDHYGALAASFAMLVYSTLLPVMLIRRNSLAGQSIYIALLILIGDIGGLFATAYAQAHLETPLPAQWMIAVNIYVLPCHVLYVGLIWWMARRDGIRVWRRF